ncbi:MAG: hypothetical protein Q9169_006402 [Polycauliona sp. 2 TL-2023]
MASPVEHIKLPGFGRPLNVRSKLKYSVGKTEKFPIALIDEGYEAEVLPLRDYVIMELVNTITDKPEWHVKVFDDGIVKKWRVEVLDSDGLDDVPESAPANTAMEVSARMFDWVIAEVRYKADIFKQYHYIEALDGVWKSDTAISDKLRKALEQAVRPLEDVPENEKDWHPGSDGQVLDLVHPSIYPLVYGQSQILANETCSVHDCTSWIGQGAALNAPGDDKHFDGSEWSKRFQWLPAEFAALPETSDVTVMSYINNLHPKDHSDLYSIISQVVARAIPLWDQVLSRVISPPMEARTCDWSNSFQGFAQSEQNLKPPDPESDEDEDEYEARIEDAHWEDMRDVIEPEPGNFKTPAERIRDYKDVYDFDNTRKPQTEPIINLRTDYGRLQIIVKLANIHLTPEDPKYSGGSWHVEGQANESICASALYYYASHNITDSYLSFRQRTHEGEFRLSYPQDEYKAVEQIYGFKQGEPAIQNLGKIHTRQSRLLCFPNVMQHRVSPFELEDPSKPGYRKLLALFLVDPHIKIISTENIPPQQHAWWKENVETAGVFEKLPPELAKMVLNGAGYPITLEAAREQRLELMAERRDFAVECEELVKEKTFNVGFVWHVQTSTLPADPRAAL